MGKFSLMTFMINDHSIIDHLKHLKGGIWNRVEQKVKRLCILDMVPA